MLQITFCYQIKKYLVVSSENSINYFSESMVIEIFLNDS